MFLRLTEVRLAQSIVDGSPVEPKGLTRSEDLVSQGC